MLGSPNNGLPFVELDVNLNDLTPFVNLNCGTGDPKVDL